MVSGAVQDWGGNANGELGNNTTVDASTPQPVPGIANAASISAGGYHTLTQKSDGTITGWGSDRSGQLGDNQSGIDHPIPTAAIYTPGLPPFASANYAYNGDGQRTTKTVNGTTTKFTWDATGLLLADNTNNYIYGPGGAPLEQIDTNNTPTWYHHDQLDNTRLLTNNAGAIVNTQTFDPYGNQTASTGTVTTPLGYNGQYADPETGFVYLRNRYYDRSTAQFLTRDPLVAITGSAYGYVDNNPLNGTDPSGMSFLSKHWRGIAMGLAVAAVVVAVVAIPVVGAGLILAAEYGAAEGASTLALATVLGGTGTALSFGQSALTCRYGTQAACSWSETTTAAGFGTNILGAFLPGSGSLAGLGTAIAGLANPHWNDCSHPSGGTDSQRNPDGSFRSGGQSSGMDPGGVTTNPSITPQP